MPRGPSVVYLLPDAVGGVASVISNLLRYRQPGDLEHHVVLTRDLSQSDCPLLENMACDSQRRVVFEGLIDNREKVLRRVRDAVPAGEGAAVTNDWLSLAALARSDVGRTLFHVVHNDADHCYEMARQHERVVDGFVAVSRLICDKLQQLLPHRSDTILHLPFGVLVPPTPRRSGHGPIRLLFVARLIREKGIYELPRIDEALLTRGVRARWTIVGRGPAEDELQGTWQKANVCWKGALPNHDVLGLYQEHDVLVLPTTYQEGLPVSLLEAMAAGVVPVVSDLPGGVQEVVRHRVSGYLHPASDTAGFAASIADLHHDPARLDTMSAAARRIVQERFDIEKRASDYQGLFVRWRELRRPRPRRLSVSYGSRLDKIWIPNWLVRTVRSARRMAVPAANAIRGATH